jgi:hypothetical protein
MTMMRRVLHLCATASLLFCIQGCAKKGGGATSDADASTAAPGVPEPTGLVWNDPAKIDATITELRANIDARLAIEETEARATALADFAGRYASHLAAALAEAEPASSRAEANLGHLAPVIEHATDAEALGRIAGTAAGVVETIRGGWGCRTRVERLATADSTGPTGPASDERVLAAAMGVLGGLVAGPVAGTGRETALRLLVEALRESPAYQHPSVALAAAEAIDAAAGRLDTEAARTLAPALVEALVFRTEEEAGRDGDDDRREGEPEDDTGDEGRMGRRDVADVDRMAGVLGPRDNPNPHMARTQLLEQVAQMGAASGLQALPFPGGSPDGSAGTIAAPDVPLAARRAMVHVAAAGTDRKEIVVHELLRGLNAEMASEISASILQLAALGTNDWIGLLRLPCASTLSPLCPQSEADLRRHRDAGSPAGAATCNRGKDPIRPGSGFDSGLEYGAVWSRLGETLADVVGPMPPGATPDPATPEGLAVAALAAQIRNTAAWVARVTDAKAVLDRIAARYPSFVLPPRDGAPAPQAASASPAAPSVAAALDRLKATLAAPGARFAGGVQSAAVGLLDALDASGSPAADLAACESTFLSAGSAARAELSALADLDHESESVTAAWWRTVAAARALGLMGATGANDETLGDVLRIAQFAFEHRMGFRIDALRAFPPALLRFRAWFAPSGAPLIARMPVPSLLDAVRSFQRPTPPVMNFLLRMMARPTLTGENPNATIAAERFLLLDADAATFAALAARAFAALFRAGPALPEADRLLASFDLYAGDVPSLRALEKTTGIDPAFQLVPSPVFGPAAGETDDWTAAPPARPDRFDFEAYRDPLVQCVLRDRETPAHAARWRREMDDAAKTQYCRKWAEPWASRFAAEMRDQDIARLDIADWRCWTHMKDRQEAGFQYCNDRDNGRSPAVELNLSAAECRAAKELDDTYFYCVDLRFQPTYVERSKPTLWGCYDEFPWLRRREPIGPSCTHLSQRILAAFLYVKFRSEAGTPAPDGVTLDALEAILPLGEYLDVAATVGAERDERVFARLDRLTQELGKVQVDFPVFRRPPTDAERLSRTEVRKPEDTRAPDHVQTPWYRHDDWIERAPRSFSELRDDFLSSCRPEDDPEAGGCAPDGGRIGIQFRITIEGGAPGPMLDSASGLALFSVRGDLSVLARLRSALAAVEGRCGRGGRYDAGCLRDVALDAGADRHARMRALYLLAAIPVSDAPTVTTVLSGLLPPAPGASEFAEPLAFLLRKARPPCCPRAEGDGCDPARCEATWLSDFTFTEWEWFRAGTDGVPAAFGGGAFALGDVGVIRHGYGSGDGVGFGRGGGRQPRCADCARSAGPDLSRRTGPAPDLRLGDPTTFGGLSAEVIRRIVRQHQNRLRHCYEAALRTSPDMTGRITVRFVIAPQGNVQSAEAAGNTTGDDGFGACIVSMIERMSFPQADRVTSCTYPFVFEMVGE